MSYHTRRLCQVSAKSVNHNFWPLEQFLRQWHLSPLYTGPEKFLNGRIFYQCNPITRNRETFVTAMVIITGDLNCNFLPKRTMESDCKQLTALLRQENLTQLINQPTRITQYSKTLLVIIITNSPHNFRECGVLSLSLSDHDMVFCIRKVNWMKASTWCR